MGKQRAVFAKQAITDDYTYYRYFVATQIQPIELKEAKRQKG